MLNLKTGKEFCDVPAVSRRDFGRGLAAILAAGVAPSIALGAIGGRGAGGVVRGAAARAGMMGEARSVYGNYGSHLIHWWDVRNAANNYTGKRWPSFVYGDEVRLAYTGYGDKTNGITINEFGSVVTSESISTGSGDFTIEWRFARLHHCDELWSFMGFNSADSSQDSLMYRAYLGAILQYSASGSVQMFKDTTHYIGVAIVRKASKYYLYRLLIDGRVQSYTNASAVNDIDWSGIFRVYRNNTYQYSSDGINALRFYDSALSTADISANYMWDLRNPIL